MSEASPLDRTYRAAAGGKASVRAENTASGPSAVLSDFADAWSMGPMWRAFAWDEIQARYRRSRIGLAWIALSYFVFVGAIAVFFGAFTNAGQNDFLAYVAVGFAVFGFVVSNLTDGCAVFRGAASWIKSTDIPYAVYVYKSIARSAFVFAVNLVCAAVILVLTGWSPDGRIVLLVPAFALVFLNAVWLQYLLGIVSARFNDIGHLVTTISRLLFFTTPILWVLEERTGVVRAIALANPVTHFVEIVRAPILGETGLAISWLLAIAFTAIGWAMTLFIGGRMRANLPFWV